MNIAEMLKKDMMYVDNNDRKWKCVMNHGSLILIGVTRNTPSLLQEQLVGISIAGFREYGMYVEDNQKFGVVTKTKRNGVVAHGT